MSRRRGILVALAILGVAWLLPPEGSHRVALRSDAVADPPPREGAVRPREAARIPRPAEPTEADGIVADSMRGTQVDGVVTLDAAGRLVIDRGLRRLFDYFLARTGERTPAQIRGDLVAWLQQQPGLSSSVRAAVAALFDRYVGMQQAGLALPSTGDEAANLAAVKALRRAWFDEPTVRAWFGEEEAYADATLLRLAQRRHGVAGDERTFAGWDEAERAATDFHLAVSQSQMLKSRNVDPEQRHKERTELWGAVAADRLAVLDRQQLAWQSRLAAYATARDHLLARHDLADAQRQVQLDSLLARSFSEPEQRRVRSLAAAGMLPSGAGHDR
ncbi:lipase secretion chaperone [Tahibacter amnicola]|uniref:Lipase chaperone n=1 Tax=Tahibacter amnicola TaxID=2976241 RepID=A0ABY6BNF8_9GAMM|nr:lipase secretion chaperone [Tahibacter amnicola]UXI69342.1 hypothetical protein N4264_06755 [Tahibacter amnicola]